MTVPKRRTIPDCGKHRRTMKRSKIPDGLYGSTLTYLKYILVWALVMLADYILEFRFEYLWPFWLFLCSAYDSFKYQGMMFSLLFVCVAVTSDVVCYFFVPVQWLFFAASTYVWVQYVWHTERGFCLPTVSLWLLFFYIEGFIRLREVKTIPFHLDLCRPFAAHCIGYPVVTLGFGFRNLISYKLRLRKQKDIERENEFYIQLLQQALPPDMQNPMQEERKAILEEEAATNGSAGGKRHVTTVGGVKLEELDYLEQPPLSSNASSNASSKHINNCQEEKLDNIVNDSHQRNMQRVGQNGVKNAHKSNVGGRKGKNTNRDKDSSNHNGSGPPQTSLAQNGGIGESADSEMPVDARDESISRLESDVKRLKGDLQSSRSAEQDLKWQHNSVSNSERLLKTEVFQLRQDNESLQNKLHNLVTIRQQDKQNISSLDRKLMEEKKSRSLLEQQLSKAKKQEEIAQARTVAALAHANTRSNECSDGCKSRRKECENEIRSQRRELKMREEQVHQYEREANMRAYKERDSEVETLMKALMAVQDKNTHLEKSLSAETKFKLDLFNALGEANRKVEFLQRHLNVRQSEVADLKSKVAEVMAVMPASPLAPSPIGDPPTSSALYFSHSPTCPSPDFARTTPPQADTVQEAVVTSSSLNPLIPNFMSATAGSCQ